MGLVLLGLFASGAAVGSLLNVAIYRFAWAPRPISPWWHAGTVDGLVRWQDRVPVFGWLTWRRLEHRFGPGFWVRPLLVELLCGTLFAALYAWEVDQAGLVPTLPVGGLRGLVCAAPGGIGAMLRMEYLAHIVLISLMIVATFIDIDEQIIPDAVTVPGTMIGLVLAAVYPWSLLPFVQAQPLTLDFLRITSPHPWPAALGGFPISSSLAIGLGCYLTWCLALVPWTWRGRRGWRMGCWLIWARLVRERFCQALGVFGSLSIALVWWLGATAWEGLLTALVGLAAGGALTWTVRIIGAAVLRREAMGFGDVTLMAMIGSFLGWQACILVFFLAPFAGLLLGSIQWLLSRNSVIPYGPFLCLAALVVIIEWAALWKQTEHIFALGWLIVAVLAICMGLMAVLLFGLQLLRRLVTGHW